MAASLKKFDMKVFRKIFCLKGQMTYSRLLQYSTTVKIPVIQDTEDKSEKNKLNDDRIPKVGMSPDGQVLICWHPEPTHPYEHTKPLPRTDEDLTQGESVLNPKLLKRLEIRHRPDGPTVAELSNMFHTSKHRWYPQSPRRKAQVMLPQNDERDSI